MKISVIIPTYNEAKVVTECLDSLVSQSYEDIEIILVDDGSTDDTLSIIKRYASQYKNIKYYVQSHLGAGAARNLGASKSSGEIFVFVDSDMTFDRDFIKKLTEPITNGKYKGTWSKSEYVSNWDNVWSRCWNINQNWENKRRHPKNYPDYQPVFRAILKKEFIRVGGYEPGGYTDDWSLSKKLGYQAVNADGAIFYHKNPSDLIEIYNHSKWVAKREYKLGFVGYFIGLVRSTLPMSIIIGLYKSVMNKEYGFLIFKIVYDWGIFVGILELLIFKKPQK